MAGRANQTDHLAAVTRVTELAPHAAAIRIQLQSVVASQAFKGSRRSQEFLQHIVEHALDGHCDDLRERTLGVQLFGRSPDYDTGDDAIVRVTACEVRKRLAQYYAEFAVEPPFRLDLPVGSYIPEVRNLGGFGTAVSGEPDSSIPEVPAAPKAVETTVVSSTWRGSRFRISSGLWAVAAVLVATLAGGWWWTRGRLADGSVTPGRVLPWSALIQVNRQTHVIFCDPDIVTVQRLLDATLTLSDYANQHYGPTPADMTPEVRQILQAVSFRGVNVAAVDTRIALGIDNLVVPMSKRPMEMHTARSVRLGDFKTEDGFVLLGSPRSNPWVELFQDQLDFTFEFDNVRKAEFIRARNPVAGEPASYVPTAEGFGTGQAYAIVALVANPGQSGRVLLIAGSNAEATEAAGKLAINLDLLTQTLRSHGIDPNGPGRSFELLLRVSTMAGSPNTSEVIACHVLKSRPTRI